MRRGATFCLENDWKRIRNDFLLGFPTIFQNISNFGKSIKPAMLEKLFTQLFEKLKIEKKNDSITTSGSFKFFVIDILEQEYGKSNYINPRTLVNYYNKYVEGSNNDSGQPKSELKDLIADYLGFKDYTDFENFNRQKENSHPTNIEVLQQPSEKIIDTKKLTFIKNSKEKSTFKKHKNIFVISSTVFILLTYFIINQYNNSNSEKCIIWTENHFEKNDCITGNTIDNSVYNIDIENFKKVEVTQNTSFFKDDNPLYWYGKSALGKMDFFTNRGIHPETLDELKPVTEYIINKYVYKDNANKTIIE